MSHFNCETCAAPCIDTPIGYVTGCVHYLPDTQNGTIRCACGADHRVHTQAGHHMLEHGHCPNCQQPNCLHCAVEPL